MTIAGLNPVRTNVSMMGTNKIAQHKKSNITGKVVGGAVGYAAPGAVACGAILLKPELLAKVVTKPAIGLGILLLSVITMAAGIKIGGNVQEKGRAS